MSGLTAIPRPRSLSEIALDSLRESIFSNNLKQGEIYNEVSLANDLGISRTPAREALRELAAHGLVTFLPRRGVIVTSYSRRDVAEIFELRRIIEVGVLGKIVPVIGDQSLAILRGYLAEQGEALGAGDHVALMKSDRRFHGHLNALADNEKLVAVLENTHDTANLSGIQSLSHEERISCSALEHEVLVDALERWDAEQAKRALLDTWTTSRRRSWRVSEMGGGAGPLVQPLSTRGDFGVEFLRAVAKIHETFPGIHTMCGLSNISYGLPERKLMNQTFAVMAVAAGLDGLNVDPLDRRMMAQLVTVEALAGRDPYCGNYLKAYRAKKFDV